jgi:hypothetical protein
MKPSEADSKKLLTSMIDGQERTTLPDKSSRSSRWGAVTIGIVDDKLVQPSDNGRPTK